MYAWNILFSVITYENWDTEHPRWKSECTFFFIYDIIQTVNRVYVYKNNFHYYFVLNILFWLYVWVCILHISNRLLEIYVAVVLWPLSKIRHIVHRIAIIDNINYCLIIYTQWRNKRQNLYKHYSHQFSNILISDKRNRWHHLSKPCEKDVRSMKVSENDLYCAASFNLTETRRE